VPSGIRAFYRGGHELIDEVNRVREQGILRKHHHYMKTVRLPVINDLFLRILPPSAAEQLPDIRRSRYQLRSTVITSNRSLED
jgi:IstB-like ATP binding protein